MELIDYNDDYSDDNSISSTEEKFGKYKKKFVLSDYLNCISTRRILEKEHLEQYFETAEKDINKLYYKVKQYCKERGTSVLRFDNDDKAKAAISGIIYKYIHKDYDITIFEKYPELAAPLIAKYIEKKNKR